MTSKATVHSSSHSAEMSKYYKFATSTAAASATATGGQIGTSDACQYQVHALQVVYIRAYVEITRLLAEYEVIIHTHSCREYTNQIEGNKEKDMENQIVKVTKIVSEYTHKLEMYKARITSAYALEVQLRAHVKMLVTRCGAMSATVSSLDKVRDAIHVLGVCPGLGRITFIIPKSTGQYRQAQFLPTQFDDATIDAAMNALCANECASSLAQTGSDQRPAITTVCRAAETSELMLRSIQDAPATNGAGVPLMGTCPNCEGDSDDPDGAQHISGHFRVCWDDGKALTPFDKRTDCSDGGQKAVLCVEDKDYANAAILAGNDGTNAGSGASVAGGDGTMAGTR